MEICAKVYDLAKDAESIWLNILSAETDIRGFTFASDVVDAMQISNWILADRDCILAKHAKLVIEQQMLNTLLDDATELDIDYESLYNNFTALIWQFNDIKHDMETFMEFAENLITKVDATNDRTQTANSTIQAINGLLVNASNSLPVLSDMVESLKALVMSVNSNGDSLPEVLASLIEVVTRLTEDFQKDIPWFESSLTHGENVVETSIEVQRYNKSSNYSYYYNNAVCRVCSILDSSLSAGNEAVKAIVDYESVVSLLSSASQIVESTNNTLRNVSESLANLMADELEDEIYELNITVEYLFAQWTHLSKDIQGSLINI